MKARKLHKNIEIHKGTIGGTPKPGVSLAGGVVRYTTETNDPLIVEFVGSLEDQLRKDTLDHALTIGVRLVTIERVQNNTLAVTDQLEAATKTVTDNLGTAGKHLVDELEIVKKAYLGQDGQLVKAIAGLAKDFGTNLDPNSKVIRDVRDAMIKDLTAAAQTLIKEIRGVMDVNADGTAVGILNKKVGDLNTALASLTAKVDAQMSVATAKRRTPAVAGTSLEEFFFCIAEPIAQACGEALEDVRDAAGAIERCKVGDFVTSIDPAVTGARLTALAVEAKNRVSVTLPKLLDELGHAMRNRGAGAAVGILTNPKAATEPNFAVYGRDKVVVFLPGFGTPACDRDVAAVFVTAGYQVGRALAIARAKGPDLSVSGIEVADVKAAVDEINTLGKKLATLKDNHTRIHSAVQNAESTTADIKDALIRAAEKLTATIEVVLNRKTS